MICEKYMALDTKEKIEFIGKICHLAMNSNLIFDECERLIQAGQNAGLFDNVTILPDTTIKP